MQEVEPPRIEGRNDVTAPLTTSCHLSDLASPMKMGNGGILANVEKENFVGCNESILTVLYTTYYERVMLSSQDAV